VARRDARREERLDRLAHLGNRGEGAAGADRECGQQRDEATLAQPVACDAAAVARVFGDRDERVDDRRIELRVGACLDLGK
jgi:hypothetical protein